MALSATFTANFSSFFDAVDKAEVKLKEFGGGADKVGDRLDRMAQSFSGQKIVQEAQLMVKAIGGVEGVTSLTEKEMARLGATTNEAVAKLKALGKDVPKDLQQVADLTKKANKETSDWVGSLGQVAAAFGIAFSIGAITNFIGSVFEAADAIGDLATQWGVSTKFAQQWITAAKGSGVEAETLGKSIQFVTEKLSEASPAYDALLRNIGLSGTALRAMKMEDVYREIAKAITDVTDETLQLDVAIGILGPNAKKMIGAYRDGLVDAAEKQKFMADETIKSLKEAKAEWENFKNAVVLYSGDMLKTVREDAKMTTASWKNFLTIATMGPIAGRDFIKAQEDLEYYRASVGKTGKDIVLLDERQTHLGKTIKTTSQVEADAKKKADALAAATAAHAKATQASQAAQDKYNDSLDDLVDTFTGRGLVDKAFLYVKALKQTIPIEQITAKQQDVINKVMWDAIEVYEAAGEQIPAALYDIWLATEKNHDAIGGFHEDLTHLGDFIKSGVLDMGKALTLDPVPMQNYFSKLGQEIDGAIEKMGAGPVKVEKWETSVGKLSKSFAQLGQITGGAFGEVAGAIGTTIGAIQLASEATETWNAGLANFKAGNYQDGVMQLGTAMISAAGAFMAATEGAGMFHGAIAGAAAGAVLGPYGAAVGFAAGALRGFFHAAAEKQDLRNAKDEIIAAAGGMQFFAERAQHAGVAWQDFTMAKSGAELEVEINKLNAAFKYQDDAMNLVISTAEKYGITLEQLGPAWRKQELDKEAMQLYQDWQVLNEAGLETVFITEKMSESVNAYIQHAMAMGVEVPSAMRPMLEAMAKSGELLDENGNAITDLEDSGINFALTMSDGFKLMVNEVKKLTDAIARGLNLAIKDIPQPKIEGQVTWTSGPLPSGPAHGGEEMEAYAAGTGGFKNFGKGTPVMLHGWEAVVPRDDAGAFATVSGAGGGGASSAAAPAIVINAQGAFFDTPESLQRLANKVSDALTAKYSVMGKLRAAV